MRLLLEDGTEMSGRAFGAAGSVGGEVVFNTAMAGYVEALTDPSYRGQILVLTYPLIGSYGVPAPRAPGSLDGPYESGRVQVQGLVVQSYVDKYSHSAAARSLGTWLEAEGVPGITGIDTGR
jgi:carbamoyl-phosphate synthase small subunit